MLKPVENISGSTTRSRVPGEAAECPARLRRLAAGSCQASSVWTSVTRRWEFIDASGSLHARQALARRIERGLALGEAESHAAARWRGPAENTDTGIAATPTSRVSQRANSTSGVADRASSRRAGNTCPAAGNERERRALEQPAEVVALALVERRQFARVPGASTQEIRQRRPAAASRRRTARTGAPCGTRAVNAGGATQ